MRITRYLALLTCVLTLGACGQREEVPHAQSLEPQDLLRLRFPVAGETQEVDLSAIEEGKKTGEVTKARAKVTPLQVVQLDDTHAWLLTKVDTDENCHACPGIMGAYSYKRDDQGWRLKESRDALLTYGGYGNLGKLSVTALEPGHHVATLAWGSCWQGTCGSWLKVLSLRADAVRDLGPGLPLSIDNDGAHEACSALDGKPRTNQEDEPEEALMPHQRECFQIQGRWQFLGKRLLMDFSGRMLEAEGEELQPLRQIKQRAVYELQAKELKLVEGENPVPGF